MHEGKWAARTLRLLGRRGKKETYERKKVSLLPLHPRNQSRLFTVILRITYSPTIFLEWIWLWTYKIVNILGSKQGRAFGWVLDLVQGFNQWVRWLCLMVIIPSSNHVLWMALKANIQLQWFQIWWQSLFVKHSWTQRDIYDWIEASEISHI